MLHFSQFIQKRQPKNVIQNDIMVLKMLKCHLSKLMGIRKVKISDVARETGLHRNTVTLLYKETATRIDLSAIEALCKFLNCGVGDLFEIVDKQ